MKTLIYSISVSKPQEFVFKKMIDKSVYPHWAKAWGEGMTFEGKWEEGEHISFFDDTHGGTKVIIEEMTPYEFIKTKHVAMVDPENIERELDDDMMRKWIGSREEYYFEKEDENRTTVKVVMLADKTFEKMMDGWNQALKYFKEICEY